MKQKFVMVLIGLLAGLGIHAQSLSPSVIAAGGQVSKGQTIQLEWTVGEAAVQSLVSPEGLITEGFHQPTLLVEEVVISPPKVAGKVTSEQLDITVAPNPVKSTLYFTLTSSLEGTAIVQVVDLWGKTLRQIETSLSFEQGEIDLSNFPAGMYMLYVRKKNGEFIKTFKITKV